MADFFIFLRRFADDILESSAESLEHILNFITVFMGSVDRCVVASSVPSPPPPGVLTHSLNFSFCSLTLFGFCNRMKNPHLRAKFAEVLEAVMPHMEPIAPGAVQPVMFQRERLFCTYRHAPQLAEALITVFVDIEFTGKVIVFKGHTWVFLSFIFLTQTFIFGLLFSFQVTLISLNRSLITGDPCIPSSSTCGQRTTIERVLRLKTLFDFSPIHKIINCQ